VEAFRIILPDGHTNFTAIREEQQFNEYIKPGEDAIWNETTCASSHGLHQNHPKIVSGKDMATVWGQFIEYTNTVVRYELQL